MRAKPKKKKVDGRTRAPARLKEKIAPARQRPGIEAQKIAILAATAGLDKKAVGVEIIDVTGKVDYADYLVLMTGHSDRHVTAIAQAVDELLSREGLRPISLEGLPQASWVLIDFVDVVVHVFEEQSRSLYDLDGLWMDARRVPVSERAASVS